MRPERVFAAASNPLVKLLQFCLVIRRGSIGCAGLPGVNEQSRTEQDICCLAPRDDCGSDSQRDLWCGSRPPMKLMPPLLQSIPA